MGACPFERQAITSDANSESRAPRDLGCLVSGEGTVKMSGYDIYKFLERTTYPGGKGLYSVQHSRRGGTEGEMGRGEQKKKKKHKPAHGNKQSVRRRGEGERFTRNTSREG